MQGAGSFLLTRNGRGTIYPAYVLSQTGQGSAHVADYFGALAGPLTSQFTGRLYDNNGGDGRNPSRTLFVVGTTRVEPTLQLSGSDDTGIELPNLRRKEVQLFKHIVCNLPQA